PVGAIQSDRNPVMPWFCGGAIMLVSTFLALILMKEEYFVRKKYSFRKKFEEMVETVRSSVRYASGHDAVRFILILGIIQYFAIQAPNMQWQPLYVGFTGNKASLGLVWAGIALSVAFGGLLSGRFLAKCGHEKKALAFSQIAIGLGIILAGAFKFFPISITIFLLHEVARGLFKPLHDVYLNDNIPSKERATIISCGSIFRHLGGIVGLLVSGLVVIRTSIPFTWIASGLVLVIGTIIIAKNGKE
ncbi:MAG: MFS transporter, partial [Patescibacteria group bacterium]|nr:MFS transporter [Patescibacteria group bacterium]